MPAYPPTAKRGNSRVWLQDGGAGPGNTVQYYPSMKGGAAAQNYGGITNIYVPDPNAYNKFQVADSIEGAEERATTTLMGRYSLADLSALRSIAKRKCRVDAYILLGECRNPASFETGWEKVLLYGNGRLETWGLDEIGALEPGENGAVNEQANLTAVYLDEIARLNVVEQAATTIVGRVNAVAVCDQVSCSTCGERSDGCQDVFALTASSGVSPASANDLVYSTNGGTTWTAVVINAFGVNDPSGLACAGDYLVMISFLGGQYAYRTKASLLAGTGDWTVVAVSPLKVLGSIFSFRADLTWIAADDGYIYLIRNPLVGYEVMLAGTATGEDLNDIHAISEWDILAVGDGGIVVVSSDGGTTWRTVTGPAAGVVLNTCWMQDANTWLVGSALGQLYYTLDAGVTWAEVTFPGSAGGSVIYDIVFDRNVPNVGYMSHARTGPVGRILRTINGGRSWYVLPEGSTTVPVHDYILSIGLCNHNTFFAGGLGDNAVDGILLKGSAA